MRVVKGSALAEPYLLVQEDPSLGIFASHVSAPDRTVAYATGVYLLVYLCNKHNLVADAMPRLLEKLDISLQDKLDRV